MQVLSKEEETKRCQDTVTRLILALSALAAHDRPGRSALEAELEVARTKPPAAYAASQAAQLQQRSRLGRRTSQEAGASKAADMGTCWF